MNVREYIESGVIEDYVLGLLTASERSEVENFLLHHSEIGVELESLTTSLSVFALLGAVEPKPYMQQRIWEVVGTPVATLTSYPDANITKSITSKSTFVFKSWLAYSTVAVLAIVSVAAVFWANSANTQLKKINAQIKTLQITNHELSQKVIALNSEIESNNSVYDLPNKQIVELVGKSNKAKNSLAIAIWDQENGDVYLDIKKIPSNPKGTNYQLYAITQIGEEIKLGIINIDKKKQILSVGKIKDAVLFKIVLENEKRNKSIRVNELFLDGKVQC